MSRPLVVLCTIGDAAAAEALARDLVESRVAACVNVSGPITSIYRWQGEIQRDDERLLLIKTSEDRFEALRGAIVARHPYEVPEIVALPIVAGHAPYLAWLAEGLS